MESKEYYLEKLRASRHELAAQLEKFKRSGQDLTGDAHDEFERNLSRLQSGLEDADRRLEELKAAGDGSWRDLKIGVGRAYDDLAASMRSIAERFR